MPCNAFKMCRTNISWHRESKPQCHESPRATLASSRVSTFPRLRRLPAKFFVGTRFSDFLSTIIERFGQDSGLCIKVAHFASHSNKFTFRILLIPLFQPWQVQQRAGVRRGSRQWCKLELPSNQSWQIDLISRVSRPNGWPLSIKTISSLAPSQAIWVTK